MKATVLDLRRNPGKILDAIERNERVTLSLRGRAIAEIVPIQEIGALDDIEDDPAVGMWADRDDLADPAAFVRELRRDRFDDI